MEISRLQMHRNRRKKRLQLLIKITVAFYLLIFSVSYLTGGTVAYFNTKGQQGFILEAGNWFDGSELEFIGKGNQNIKSCPDVEISVQIKNQGFKMVGPANYEVYYVESGEPRIGGTVETNGVISPLNAGEETTLTFVASKDGFYEFKAYQREGYEGDNKEIWSKKIKVKCKENRSENEKQESEVIEETNEASKVEEKLNEEEEAVTGDSGTEEESTESESGETDTPQAEQNNENQPDETDSNPNEDDQVQENSSEETTNVETEKTESDPAKEGETNEETN